MHLQRTDNPSRTHIAGRLYTLLPLGDVRGYADNRWSNRAMTLFTPVCTYVDRVRSAEIL